MARYVVIMTNTEDQLQGTIRAIEALDAGHEIRIIHGTYEKDTADEIMVTLADLSKALILKTPNIKVEPHPYGREVQTMDLLIPELNMESVIEHIKEEYGDQLIKDLLKGTKE